MVQYRVFISHTSVDTWVATQIARRVHQDSGADYFLDVHDIAKGDDIEGRIFSELPKCDELIALVTPWSLKKSWLWVEIGAARALQKRIVGMLYGISTEELALAQNGPCLGPTNVANLNDFEQYLGELSRRISKAQT